MSCTQLGLHMYDTTHLSLSCYLSSVLEQEATSAICVLSVSRTEALLAYQSCLLVPQALYMAGIVHGRNCSAVIHTITVQSLTVLCYWTLYRKYTWNYGMRGHCFCKLFKLGHLVLVRTLLRSGHFTSQDTLLLGKGVLICLVPRLSPSCTQID